LSVIYVEIYYVVSLSKAPDTLFILLVGKSSNSAHGTPTGQPSFAGLQFWLVWANGVHVLQSLQHRRWSEHVEATAVAMSGKAPVALYQAYGHFSPALLASHCEFDPSLFLFTHISQSVSQSV